ncbi:MAG: ribonuclease III [Candidatus Shapirobacteria bacterium]
MDQLKQLENSLHLQFQNLEVLRRGLTHRSYLNENRSLNLASNERYEFLGDAILELWVSEKIFHLFPDFSEGELTNLRALTVCTENLSGIAKKIDLGAFILLSKGEEAHGGRQNQSILADTFESLIGAIFLDQGASKASTFLDEFVEPNLIELSQKKVFKDPKSLFQEIAQNQEGVTPTYKTLSESGPDHQKAFEVGAFVGDRLIAKGTGNSKLKAESDAATTAAKVISLKKL